MLEACAAGGVLVSRSHGMAADAVASAPSLRVMVTVRHSDEDLRALARALGAAARSVLERTARVAGGGGGGGAS